MFRRGGEFWITAIAEFERSKLTQEAFTQRRGARWRRYVVDLSGAPESVSLVPVRVIASTAPTVRRSSESADELEVELASGERLRFATSIDLDDVAALAQLLG